MTTIITTTMLMTGWGAVLVAARAAGTWLSQGVALTSLDMDAGRGGALWVESVDERPVQATDARAHSRATALSRHCHQGRASRGEGARTAPRMLAAHAL